MKALRNALAVWVVFTAWTWMWGPLGWVTGGLGFGAGWAFGHRTGRHDAEREHWAAYRRYIEPSERWSAHGNGRAIDMMEGDRP